MTNGLTVGIINCDNLEIYGYKILVYFYVRVHIGIFALLLPIYCHNIILFPFRYGIGEAVVNTGRSKSVITGSY